MNQYSQKDFSIAEQKTSAKTNKKRKYTQDVPFKSQLCIDHKNGGCKHQKGKLGRKCHFAHGASELQSSKTTSSWSPEERLQHDVEKLVPKDDKRCQAVYDLALHLSQEERSEYDHERFVQSLWVPALNSTHQEDLPGPGAGGQGAGGQGAGGESKTGANTPKRARFFGLDVVNQEFVRKNPGVATLLINAIDDSVFYNDGEPHIASYRKPISKRQRYDLTNRDATHIDSCHLILQDKSPYRKAKDSSQDFGLCNEARVWKSMKDQHIGCPTCGCLDLKLGGGSAAAWGDIACPDLACRTLLEVKSFAEGGVQRSKKGFMFGGSYKWFKAQERKAVNHYAIIAPQGDGNVTRYKIDSIRPDPNVKFVSYFNDKPKRAKVGTSVNLDLETETKLFETTYTTTERFKRDCNNLAEPLLRRFFSGRARILQRLFRNCVQYETVAERVAREDAVVCKKCGHELDWEDSCDNDDCSDDEE